MVAISYHDDLKEVQGDVALAAFLSDRVQAAPFDRLEWFAGLADDCGLAPFLAVARDGRDLAVLALARGEQGLIALANWYSFRWRPLTAGDGARLLPALARDMSRRAARITLHGLPEADALALAASFRAAGWFTDRRMCDTNHFAVVAGRCYGEFLAGRPGALRNTIRRKSGALECAVLTRFDAGAWRHYEAIYAGSWKPGEGSPAFLRAFAEAEGSAGRLRLGLATSDGQPVAAQFWTVEGGTAFIHKLAHRDDAAPLSPGTVLSAAMFRHAIDVDRVAEIDFGTGDDAYKADWMEGRRPRFALELMRPAAAANWPRLAKAVARRVLAGSRDDG